MYDSKTVNRWSRLENDWGFNVTIVLSDVNVDILTYKGNTHIKDTLVYWRCYLYNCKKIHHSLIFFLSNINNYNSKTFFLFAYSLSSYMFCLNALFCIMIIKRKVVRKTSFNNKCLSCCKQSQTIFCYTGLLIYW